MRERSAVTYTCPHHGPCPGCPLLDVGEPAQREHKHASVSSALSRYAPLAPVTIAPLQMRAPTFGYRTRAKWRVGRGGAVGLFAAGTHDVIDVVSCGAVRPVLASVGAAVRRWLRDPEAPPWLRSVEDGGALSAIDVREVIQPDGAARALLMLVLDHDVPLRELELFAPRLTASCPDVVSVAAHRRTARHTVLGGITEALRGPLEVHDRLAPGLPPLLATHGAFVQAHRGVAAAMIENIVAAVTANAPRHGRVLELFAGSGSLALTLAARGLHVTAVESFGPAVDRMRRAADDAGVADRVVGIAADAARVAVEASHRGERFDAVVVNPPRTGLAPDLRAAIVGLGAPLVVYVSCEPRTLARDLSDLGVMGLAPSTVAPFDMMPQTAQVETLAVLTPHPWRGLTVLHEDEALIAVDKPPHVPTTPQGEHALSLLALVRHAMGAPRATPVHRLDRGTSGVCLFARTEADVAPIAAALSSGIKRYLALVRGVPHGKGKIDRPLRDEGRDLHAVTRYTRKQVVLGHALLSVRPEQGRTHQIRRHLASIDRPILGDVRYGHGPSNEHLYQRFGLDRPFLHVQSIELAHRGATLALAAPLAPDLSAVLDAMRDEQSTKR